MCGKSRQDLSKQRENGSRREERGEKGGNIQRLIYLPHNFAKSYSTESSGEDLIFFCFLGALPSINSSDPHCHLEK